MSRKIIAILGVVFLCAISLRAQEQKGDHKVLKNSDILLMSQDHFDDDTLIRIINISKTDFDMSEEAVLALKNQGVSAAVLRAMLVAEQRKKIAAEAAAAPAPTSAATPAAANVSPPAASPSTPALATRPAAAPADATGGGASTPAGSAATPAAGSPVSGSGAPTGTGSESTPDATSPAPSNAGGFAAMQGGRGMKHMNAQQMAAMQSQVSSMMPMMGGMMSGMGGVFTMNYPPEQMPHVYLMHQPDKSKEEFSPSAAQIAKSKFKGGPSAKSTILRSLATEGLSFAAVGAGPAGMMAMSAFSVASGFMPGFRASAPSLTYVWGLPGRKSERELGETTPAFELSYGDIPGVDPDAYEPELLHLVQTKDNYRLVGATRTKLSGRSMGSGIEPENGKWISEERCPIRIAKEERGFYVVHVDQALEPGEYAVVLRPVKNYKASLSGFGGGAQVFYSVWDFSVPGTPPETGKKKK
jgi:hypothetical protein